MPVEANEKWRPYSLPLRPFNRGYLPLCYDSKTPLGSPRSSLIYEPTTVPFVILPSLYLLSPLSPSLFFHIVQASYRRVPPRHLAHASKRVHRSCTPSISNPALDRVTTVLAPSYKSRGHEPPCSTVNFGPRDRRPPSPIVSINEIYVTDARDPGKEKGSLNGFREGMLFVERESRKCAKLFIINSTKFLNVKAQEIARNDIYDNRKEGWKEGGGDLSRCTRTDFYEDYYEWRGGMETLASRREILKEEGNLNSCDVVPSLYRWFFNGSFESGSRIEKLMPPRTG